MALLIYYTQSVTEVEELAEFFQSCPDKALEECLKEVGYEPDSNEAQAKAQAEADAKADDDAKALAEKAKAEAKLQDKIDRINRELNELYEAVCKAKDRLGEIKHNPELIRAEAQLEEADAQVDEAERRGADDDELDLLYENANAALSRVDVLMKEYYRTEDLLYELDEKIDEKEDLLYRLNIILEKLKALVSFFEIMEGLEELSIELEKLNA